MGNEEIIEMKKRINDQIFSCSNTQFNIFSMINLRYALVIFHSEIKAMNNNSQEYLRNYQKYWLEVVKLDSTPLKHSNSTPEKSLTDLWAYLHALINVYQFELSSMKKMEVYYG